MLERYEQNWFRSILYDMLAAHLRSSRATESSMVGVQYIAGSSV